MRADTSELLIRTEKQLDDIFNEGYEEGRYAEKIASGGLREVAEKRLSDEEAVEDAVYDYESRCDMRGMTKEYFTCTRPKGHNGEHIDCGCGTVFERWENTQTANPTPEDTNSELGFKAYEGGYLKGYLNGLREGEDELTAVHMQGHCQGFNEGLKQGGVML